MIRLAIGAASLLIIAGSAVLIPSEFKSLRQQNLEFRTMYQMQYEGQYALDDAGANLTRNGQLRSCASGLLSQTADFYAADARNAIADTCAARAEEVIADAPTMSLPYLVQGAVAATKGEFDLYESPLSISHSTNPNDAWYALRRVEAAYIVAAKNGADGIPDFIEDDVKTALGSRQFYQGLIDLYFRFPALQDQLVATVQTADGSMQRRFLSGVRARLQGT